MKTTKPQSFQEMCFLYAFLRRGFEFLILTYFLTLLLAFEVSLYLGTFMAFSAIKILVQCLA